MGIKCLPTWGFAYKEISGECGEVDWRRVDFYKDDPIFRTGNVLVYIEFDFPPRKPGENVKAPGYSGKFVVRKIKQTIRDQPGIMKGYVAMLLEETESNAQITKEVAKIIAKHEKVGGLISLPV